MQAWVLHWRTHQHNHTRRRITLKWDEKQIYTNKYREHEHDNGHDYIYGSLWHLSSSFRVRRYILPFRLLVPIHMSILNESSLEIFLSFVPLPKIRASYQRDRSSIICLFILSHWHEISARCACQFTTHIWLHYCALGLAAFWVCIRFSCRTCVGVCSKYF